MATNYKNILLKDSQGQPLLPITLSYYVEYKGGVDVRSYLDTLSHDVDSVNSYIDSINAAIAQNGQVSQSIIASVNEILESYIQRPDHTANIQFDNAAQGLSTNLSGLQPAEENGYVTAQQAIEALDNRIESAYTYLNTVEGRITTAESDIDALETSVGGLDTRLDTAESDIDALETKVNGIFTEEGALDISASAIKYTGSSAAGTATSYNVQDAIDTIGTKVEGLAAMSEAAINSAGVSYVRGVGGVLVGNLTTNPVNNTRLQGDIEVTLNLGTNGKLMLENGVVTVDESKLDLTGVTTYANNISGEIQASQIAGGLKADNINITYTYTETVEGATVEHNDGQKTVQEFYDDYLTKIENLEAASNSTALDGKYKVTVTPSDSTDFAKVYTLTQNSETIGTINIPKDQFLDSVYYINSQDEVATKLPSGMTLTTEELTELPALVFIWKVNTAKTYSVVSIKSILGTVTNEIDTKVNALETRVDSLETKVENLETASATHITGVTLDGTAGTISNGIVSLTSTLKYEGGTSTDGVSDNFLEMHGIPVPTNNS